jgi:hypothetical protein
MASPTAKNGLRDVEAANYADVMPPPASWGKAIGNPAPLGLLAFGMTTWFLMSVDALWSGKVFVGAVMGYAYAYGGFAQMVAGVLEVRGSRCGAGARRPPGAAAVVRPRAATRAPPTLSPPPSPTPPPPAAQGQHLCRHRVLLLRLLLDRVELYQHVSRRGRGR